MEAVIPSDFIDQLKEIIGKRLIGVTRWLFEEDRDRADFEQDADGAVVLVFDSSSVLYVQADPERQGLKVSDSGPLRYSESYRVRDVSSNQFWMNRTGMRVVRIEIVKSNYSTSQYPMEFGLIFYFENKLMACLEFIDTEDWPDTMRVRDRIETKDSMIISIEGAS